MKDIDFKAMTNELKDKMKEAVPGTSFVPKEESKFMKILNILLFFVSGFMTNFTTTIGKTIYTPKGFYDNAFGAFATLAHEYVHLYDDQFLMKGYKLQYLFPQILAIFSLLSILAIFNLSFLWFLLFLLFLAPLPAPGRTKIELRGYGMSIKVRQWLGIEVVDKHISYYAQHFTGPEYYYMWPFKNIKSALSSWQLGKECCVDDLNPAYRDVAEIISKHV